MQGILITNLNVTLDIVIFMNWEPGNKSNSNRPIEKVRWSKHVNDSRAWYYI